MSDLRRNVPGNNLPGSPQSISGKKSASPIDTAQVDSNLAAPIVKASAPKSKSKKASVKKQGLPSIEAPLSGIASIAMPQNNSDSTASSPEERQRMIAEAAYYRAERRGFDGGDQTQDWLEAEAEVDARLRREQTPSRQR